jgi:hypothetical protein
MKPFSQTIMVLVAVVLFSVTYTFLNIFMPKVLFFLMVKKLSTSYDLNNSMTKYLIDSLDRIDHTVDLTEVPGLDIVIERNKKDKFGNLHHIHMNHKNGAVPWHLNSMLFLTYFVIRSLHIVKFETDIAITFSYMEITSDNELKHRSLPSVNIKSNTTAYQFMLEHRTHNDNKSWVTYQPEAVTGVKTSIKVVSSIHIKIKDAPTSELPGPIHKQ